MAEALRNGDAGQVRLETLAKGPASWAADLPLADGEAPRGAPAPGGPFQAARTSLATRNAIRLMADVVRLTLVGRGHLPARRPSQANAAKVEGREVAALTPRARALARNGA